MHVGNTSGHTRLFAHEKMAFAGVSITDVAGSSRILPWSVFSPTCSFRVRHSVNMLTYIISAFCTSHLKATKHRLHREPVIAWPSKQVLGGLFQVVLPFSAKSVVECILMRFCHLLSSSELSRSAQHGTGNSLESLVTINWRL